MVKVADLRVGDLFQPIHYPPMKAARLKVVTIGPSRMQEDHHRIEVRSTGGKSSKVSLVIQPGDMEVSRITTIPTPPKPACRCRNHMGTKKHLHKTREAAAEAILHHHLRYGAHSIYPCPSGLGYHVKSKKLKVDGRNT